MALTRCDAWSKLLVPVYVCVYGCVCVCVYVCVCNMHMYIYVHFCSTAHALYDT